MLSKNAVHFICILVEQIGCVLLENHDNKTEKVNTKKSELPDYFNLWLVWSSAASAVITVDITGELDFDISTNGFAEFLLWGYQLPDNLPPIFYQIGAEILLVWCQFGLVWISARIISSFTECQSYRVVRNLFSRMMSCQLQWNFHHSQKQFTSFAFEAQSFRAFQEQSCSEQTDSPLWRGHFQLYGFVDGGIIFVRYLLVRRLQMACMLLKFLLSTVWGSNVGPPFRFARHNRRFTTAIETFQWTLRNPLVALMSTYYKEVVNFMPWKTGTPDLVEICDPRIRNIY